MNNIKEFKKEILTFQKEILNDLKPYVVGNDDFLQAENWYTNSNNVFLYNQKGKLYIAGENAKRDYISFREKNNSFSLLPKNEIRVLPDETLRIEVQGNTFGKISIDMFIVEYSSNEKINSYIVHLNKATEIITSRHANALRFAFKVSGIGLANIYNIKLERKKEFNKDYDFLKTNKKNPPVKLKNISDLKMACIFDEFTTTCYQEEVNLINFTPNNWKEILIKNQPDVLMVESAWKGNQGSWEYKIAKYNNGDKEPISELVDWCKRQGIPTIFWNKEDPIHFEKFIDSARLFDYIFTTDANMISKYQEMAGHKNVYALPFSAQPKLHNPIKIADSRINKISFAGSYYANRHEDRKRDMDDMLDLAAAKGLDIYDRNYEKNLILKKSDFRFPERFTNNIKGSLEYDEIEKAYKGYKVMLNVNSVKNSPTMFSRRVFEGLASGTPIVSSYSDGVKNLFNDIVLVSENKEELKRNLDKLMNDDLFYNEKSLEGIREVFLNHTYQNRIRFILEKVGISVEYSIPSVTVLAIANSKKQVEYLVERFNLQSWREKKLIILLNNFNGYIEVMNKYNSAHISSFVLSYMNHYKRVSEIIDSEFIAFFNSKDYYGENYLMDLMIATKYSRSAIIGKSTIFEFEKKLVSKNPGHEYEFVNDLTITRSIVNKKVFHGVDLEKVIKKLKHAGSLNEFFKKGHQLLSIDKFNYIQSGQEISNKYKEIIEL
ncbi:glycosyltransferase [Paucisalibacillus sp. EB02]|uniref:CgeB family protein n=1 Tax=Paucisalibacillus sp. EB02 TaxID=1347087 RepID=UPI0004B4A223|nr:glycosyltransferase [Paucisalibacillus sp. EB02]